MRLGQRESGTARLNDAVSAYREALKERTRAGVLLDWTTTQKNLDEVEKVIATRSKQQP